VSDDKPFFSSLSVLRAVRSDNVSDRSRAFELIVVVSWKAVHKYIRRRWGKSKDDAKTITLAFFSRMMRTDFFDRYDPARIRFRTFLREQIDQFISTEGAVASEPESLALDFQLAEEELALEPIDPNQPFEQSFDGEWVRGLFTLAIEQLHNDLEAHGRLLHFRLFQRFDLQDRSGGENITLDQVAQEFSLSATEVASCLSDVRQSLRTIILDLLRSFTSSNEELRQEARSLFGL
jgi:hypothetical protein